MPTSRGFMPRDAKQSSSDVMNARVLLQRRKTLKSIGCRTLTGSAVDQPLSKVFANTQLARRKPGHAQEHSASYALGSKLESLILAQNERWRQASNMQV